MLFVVMLIGSTVPYFITQPSSENDVQIVSPAATIINLMCSLNINIPPGVVITWLYNGSVFSTITEVDPPSNSIVLLLGKPKPSDAGVYQCVFNDTNTGYILRRNITVLSMYNTYFT